MLPMTSAAVSLVQRLANGRGVAPNLRVRILAGGCSGLTWDMELGAAERADDHRRITEGVTVLVDPVSAPFLRGGKVDLKVPTSVGLRTPLLDADGRTALSIAGLLGRNLCRCSESFSPG